MHIDLSVDWLKVETIHIIILFLTSSSNALFEFKGQSHICVSVGTGVRFVFYYYNLGIIKFDLVIV